MDKNTEAIYRELQKNITVQKLKELSVDIISRYKAKDLNSLLRYADILEFDASGMNISRLFARVIQNYHPDKTAMILGGIEESFKTDNVSELLRYKKIYLFSRLKKTSDKSKYDINIEETYTYSDDYFGSREDETPADDIYDRYEPEDEFDDGSSRFDYGFIEAVNNLFFGGLDDSITPEDLQNIEGELDLSDSDIVDLKGIEHCRNITILNLSGNRIDKIDRLKGLELLELLYISENEIENIDSIVNLKNLKELDISFNSIEDISVLLKLEELVYVNLMGNPVKNKNVIKELEERGVIVIS